MQRKSRGRLPPDAFGPYRYRFTLMGVIIAAATLFMAGALSIPFFFESPSMWYKFGLAKILLRSGKVVGTAAAVLLFYQLILVARLKVLDRVFSHPGLVRTHRLNAIVILLLACLHPVLVLTSDNTLVIPLEMRYWPEWLGVGLLALIVVQFSTSRWRTDARLRFHRWMFLHRWLGFTVLGIVTIHILYVSETYSERGFPRNAVILLAVLLAFLWLWIRSGWLRARKRPFSVTRVAPEGTSSVGIELRPVDKRPFRYVPGQFVIVSFQSKHISPEPHPFTLSSTPTRPEYLQVHRADQWRLDPACRPDYRGGAGLYSRPVRSVQPCVYRSGSRDRHDRRRYRHHPHAEYDALHGRSAGSARHNPDMEQSIPGTYGLPGRTERTGGEIDRVSFGSYFYRQFG